MTNLMWIQFRSAQTALVIVLELRQVSDNSFLKSGINLVSRIIICMCYDIKCLCNLYNFKSRTINQSVITQLRFLLL